MATGSKSPKSPIYFDPKLKKMIERVDRLLSTIADYKRRIAVRRRKYGLSKSELV